MIVKKHTPEQWNRINAFIQKAKAEKCVPESYYAHVGCEINLTAWEAFGHLKAELMSINPLVQINYLLTRETPEVKPTRDMRKCASRALIEVAKLGQVERAQGIINDLGADVNYMDDGHTPLYHAIRRKRLGMAEMLLKNGANNNRHSNNTLSPLNLACAMGFDMAIPLFMKYGVDINQPVEFKSWRKFHLGYQTFCIYPLAIAISQNQPKTCQTLLDNGAKLDLNIRKDLTIREFAQNNWESFSPEMKATLEPVISSNMSTQKNNLLPEQENQTTQGKTTPEVSVDVEVLSIRQQTEIKIQKISVQCPKTPAPGSERIRS